MKQYIFNVLLKVIVIKYICQYINSISHLNNIQTSLTCRIVINNVIYLEQC